MLRRVETALASPVHSSAQPVSLAKPWAALVVVQVLFGSLPAVSKFAIAEVPPQVVVICRSLAATCVFALLARLCRLGAISRARALPLRIHLQLAGLAILGVCLNQTLLFYGLKKTTSAAAAILAPNISLFALLVSIALGRERFTLPKGINIAFGTAGVALLFAPHLADTFRSEAALGNLMCLASAFCYASYLALSPPAIARTGSLLFSLLVFFYASFFNVALYFALTGVSPARVPGLVAAALPVLSGTFWAALAFLVLGATVVTYLLNAYALGRLPAGIVGGLVCSQAVIGVLLSSALVGEAVPVEYLGAMALVLVGVLVLWVSNLREYRIARQKERVAFSQDAPS